MNAGRRSLSATAAILSGLAFVYGLWCVYLSHRDLVIAKSEMSTIGVAKFEPKSNGSSIFDLLDDLQCRYYFSVEGRPYSGHELCPQQTKGASTTSPMGAVGGLVMNVTVFYDPTNPTRNSMMDFSAKSAWDSRKAMIFIAVGVVLSTFSLFGALLAAKTDVPSPQSGIDSDLEKE